MSRNLNDFMWHRPSKVQANYLLPETLKKRISHLATELGVRPCVVAERALEEGLDLLTGQRPSAN